MSFGIGLFICLFVFVVAVLVSVPFQARRALEVFKKPSWPPSRAESPESPESSFLPWGLLPRLNQVRSASTTNSHLALRVSLLATAE